MDAAAFATLSSKAATICGRTRALCQGSAGLKAQSLQLLCALTALQGEIAAGVRSRKMSAERRHPARLSSLFEPPGFDAMRAANRLVDEFGRRARIVAVQRALGCRSGGDHDGAANWNAAFDAVMEIQAESWAAAQTRRGSGQGVS